MTRLVLIVFAVLLRLLTGLYSYSGEATPPLFGDYEAQRHWMEVTYNLNVTTWYNQSQENDLYYWGLDYPPLTAYHSWLCGVVAHSVNPNYVKLGESRGYESPQHKFFMRWTVIVADLVTYLLAVGLFAEKFLQRSPQNEFPSMIWVFLTFPGIILIDHGHFQYNCVSLGLVFLSILALRKKRDITSSVLFCLALNYKQMSLYYALPIFFYFVGKSVRLCQNYGFVPFCAKLFKLSASVIITFSLIWLPFLTDKYTLAQVIHRIFPFERGLFEDKVANFWCVLNVIFKIRSVFDHSQLALLSSIVTLISVLPSSIHLLFGPHKERLTFSLINSSLGFFLFSYQVHEKTILFPALPVMLCFNEEPLHSFWFLTTSVFSLFPLMVKDNLIVPFVALTTLFMTVVLIAGRGRKYEFSASAKDACFTWFKYSTIVNVILCLSSIVFKAPKRFPHLFPTLISLYSAMHFGYFFLYFNYKQFTVGTKLKDF